MKQPRTLLPAKKGREVLGILMFVLAVLLAASLISFHPSDPSILHQSTQPVRVRNVIGSYGADAAAIFLGSLGLTAFFVPLLLLVAAIRKVRAADGTKVVGRGLGAIVILGSLPVLLQLTLGAIHWMGASLPAGGAVGELLADALRRHLGTTGALFVSLGAVVIGSTLLVQATLGEMLAEWNRRLRAFWERRRLGRERRRERRQKERARKRVVAKQLERAREAETRAQSEPERRAAVASELDLPLRVEEKPGVGSFAVRRVVAASEGAGGAAARGKEPQAALPFKERATGGEKLPPLNLLRLDAPRPASEESELVRLAETIRNRCAEFGVEGTVEGISPGPVITVFEFQPAPGVKVSQI
ncbi:MAG TPA: DNA translocase FtsK 4TM domain-containing protein, partial [Thermoanaerobaculia bacterium]|nr:DNA translocase FtsK 4TM domain-containing protein [Thermoanaerobaculia bacterium]